MTAQVRHWLAELEDPGSVRARGGSIGSVAYGAGAERGMTESGMVQVNDDSAIGRRRRHRRAVPCRRHDPCSGGEGRRASCRGLAGRLRRRAGGGAREGPPHPGRVDRRAARRRADARSTRARCWPASTPRAWLWSTTMSMSWPQEIGSACIPPAAPAPARPTARTGSGARRTASGRPLGHRVFGQRGRPGPHLPQRDRSGTLAQRGARGGDRTGH